MRKLIILVVPFFIIDSFLSQNGIVEGTIRWIGAELKEYDGITWKSLTLTGNSSWNYNGNGREIYYDDNAGIGRIDADKPLDMLGRSRIQSSSDGENHQLEVVETSIGRGGIQFINSNNPLDYWALGAREEINGSNKIGWYRNQDDKVIYRNNYYGLRYAEFVVPLVKAIQELSKQGKSISSENAELRSRLDKIESQISSLISNPNN